jgi:class 3 adenylate cyclase
LRRIGKSHTTRCRLKSSPQDARLVAEERGSHELKGVPEPVTLFQIIRVSGGGRRARAK